MAEVKENMAEVKVYNSRDLGQIKVDDTILQISESHHYLPWGEKLTVSLYFSLWREKTNSGQTIVLDVSPSTSQELGGK